MLTQEFFISAEIAHTPLFQGAKKICARLQEAGYETYLVGGCVRDFLLFPAKKPLDLDIATAASPQQVAKLFAKTTFAGETFGVSRVKLEGLVFEVATFRTEGASLNQRHPEWVELGGTLETDSERRDFTINSLYYDPLTQRLHAPQAGALNDLEQGILRCVGDPDIRFQEDALRMVRLCRFAANFCFSLDPATESAAKNDAPLVATLPRERFLGECIKVKNHCLFLELLNALKLLPHIFVRIPETCFEALTAINAQATPTETSKHRLAFFRLWIFIVMAAVNLKISQTQVVLREELETWPLPRQEKRLCLTLIRLLCFHEAGGGPKPVRESSLGQEINPHGHLKVSGEELEAQGFAWFLEAYQLDTWIHPDDRTCVLKHFVYALQAADEPLAAQILSDFQQRKYPALSTQKREELRKMMEEKNIPIHNTANVYALAQFLGIMVSINN